MFQRSHLFLIVLLAVMPGERAIAAPAPVGSGRSGEISIPLAQVLAEAETAMTAKRHGDVAALLDRVLSRAERGEPLPAGLAQERLAFAAATAHFRRGNLGRALQRAAPLVTAPPRLGSLAADARWLTALSLAGLERFAEAAGEFAAMAESPAYRDKASLYQAMAAQQAGQPEKAIAAYHRHLERAPRDEAWTEAAMAVIALHLDQQQFDEARRGLRLLHQALDRVDNVAALNLLSLRLGDAAMAADDPATALAAYRAVRLRDDLLALQAEKDRRLERQRAQVQAAAHMRAADMDTARRLEGTRERIRAALAEIAKIANHDAAVLMRRGQAFLRRGNIWEAALVFERVLQPQGETSSDASPEGERALAGLVTAYAESGRTEKTLTAARRFSAAYPRSGFAAQVFFLAANKAHERGDARTQLEFLELALQGNPAPELLEPLRLMQAHALFAAGRHDEARQSAETYLRAFPEGRFAEDASYLQAMAGLLLGSAARAVAEIVRHLERYPEGRFVADACYRLAAAEYSQQHYESAQKLTAEWLGNFADDHVQRGEVLSLRGDILAAQAKADEAIVNYHEALAHPLADEGLGYAMDELTRLLMAQGRLDEAAEHWAKLAEERPDSIFAINAAYWIGRIRSRQGKHDQAVETMTRLARRYLADPQRDSVERLLLELARVLAARGASSRGQALTAPGTPSSAARSAPRSRSASATDETPADAWLLKEELKTSATARARALFLQAEVASLQRNTAESERLLKRIVATTPTDALPPGLLGRLGDLVWREGDSAKADELYRALVTRFPRSPFADFGYVGLGELALRSGDAEQALGHFMSAVDKAGAAYKLKESTLGKARALLALERWDEARAVFEHIAAHRAWRGPATAESLFSLGEILRQRGDPESLAQAQAHFQRLYLGYRKHEDWVAKAYLRSGEVLEKLGRPSDALATYQELLRDARLQKHPEAKVAERNVERLQSLTDLRSTRDSRNGNVGGARFVVTGLGKTRKSRDAKKGAEGLSLESGLQAVPYAGRSQDKDSRNTERPEGRTPNGHDEACPFIAGA